MFRLLAISGILVLLASCRKDTLPISENPKGQFIVIGHAYGNPVAFQLRLYRGLIPVLANIETYLNPNKYIFTGDVVAKPTSENWNNTLHQLDSLGIHDFWIAPGNHDLGSSFFNDSIQSNSFFAERVDNNLFLILNTNFSGWTVDQAQIDFLYSELNSLNGIHNIFVFSHQVWWAKPLNAVYEMGSIKTNSKNLFAGDRSFWTDVFPMFQSANLPTFFFAGDVGAWDFIPAYVERQFDNFHFYASGLGGGAEDNVINIKTYDNGTVIIDKIDF